MKAIFAPEQGQAWEPEHRGDRSSMQEGFLGFSAGLYDLSERGPCSLTSDETSDKTVHEGR